MLSKEWNDWFFVEIEGKWIYSEYYYELYRSDVNLTEKGNYEF